MRVVGRWVLRTALLMLCVAVIVFELAALLPSRVDPDTKVAIVLHDGDRSPLPRVLAFLEPWRKLCDGERIGSLTRYSAGELFGALVGSLRVGAIALVFALSIGTCYAVARRIRRRTLAATLTVLPVIAYGTPTFITCLALAIVFGVPSSPEEYGSFEWVMAGAMAVGPAMFFGSVLDDALAEELRKPYIDTAIAKGCGMRAIIVVHALPNAIPALLDALPPMAAALLTGSFIAEKLFNVKHFALIYVNAALAVDVEVVVVTTTMFASVLLVVGAVAAIARRWVDPRTRTP